MTLGWTDGCSFMPINSVLLSSQKSKNMIGENKVIDQPYYCWQARRMLARAKGTDVIDQLNRSGNASGPSSQVCVV